MSADPTPTTDDAVSYPRESARTQRYTLGEPRDVVVSPDGRRIVFLRSRGGTDTVNCLWVVDAATGEERLVADPELLLSLSIAPLRFVPISWGPPVVVRSPWAPPPHAPLTVDDRPNPTSSPRFAARRIWAFGLAATAAVVAAAALAANL
jgi:hypothetical protein